MKRGTYRLCTVAIAIALGLVVGWSISLNSPVIPLVAVAVAFLLRVLCQRATKEVLADERSHLINQKASSVTFRVFIVSAALLALALFSFRSFLPDWAVVVASTLAYGLCLLSLLHLGLYSYYSRKM